ncbi:hypothetical protein OTU49_008038 [Cherax quadricarinatus]|uniref:Centromere protein M n=2 Tax=Cherax quadricarinatus TaxID=27406 RepID=A0AAW0WRX2_CHEQU
MEQEGNKRKPIMRDSTERTEKKLSFATRLSQVFESPVTGSSRLQADIIPTNIQERFHELQVTPQKKMKRATIDSTVTSSPGTQASRVSGQSELHTSTAIAAPFCKSIRHTSMGLCYVPEETSVTPHSNHLPTVPMKDNTRNVFRSILNNTFTTKNAANVLILGDKLHGEKIKNNLLYQHSLQKTTSSLACSSINLNIICEENPPESILPDVHFCFILICMDDFHGLTSASDGLMKLHKASVPVHHMLVLSVSNAREVCKSVIDQEEYEAFLDDHKLAELPWQEQERACERRVMQLLNFIYSSVGFYSGSSLLLNYTFLHGVKEVY